MRRKRKWWKEANERTCLQYGSYKTREHTSVWVQNFSWKLKCWFWRWFREQNFRCSNSYFCSLCFLYFLSMMNSSEWTPRLNDILYLNEEGNGNKPNWRIKEEQERKDSEDIIGKIYERTAHPLIQSHSCSSITLVAVIWNWESIYLIGTDLVLGVSRHLLSPNSTAQR